MQVKRKKEKILVRIGGIWNIITGTSTLFYYHTWFQHNLLFEHSGDVPNLMFERFINQHVSSFIMLFGLLFTLVGALNIYLSTQMVKKNAKTSNKIPIWLSIWTLISFITVDIIGVLLYLPATVIYIFNNKAIKIINHGS